MPRAPLPAPLDAWLSEARPAVVATAGASGAPVTAATWYDLVDGRVVLTMDADGPRHRNLLRDPRLSLTALGDDWYQQVTVRARVVEFRGDPDLVDVDAMSQRYRGEPYSDRASVGVTAVAVIERWSSFGLD